ncbi:MAG TPA: hypothetical protein VGF75_05520 [Candidatus Saccharimonadales bacterium]|jgi:hypothetical protein
MFRSKDPHLDIEIQMCEQRLRLLKELKELRKGKIVHKPLNWERTTASMKNKGLDSVTKVTCVCGEITKYKVPLRTLSDFKCPKDKDRS